MKKIEMILLVLTLFLDQISKYILDASMLAGESIPVIDGFFSITYVHNTGAAWSMLEGQMLLFGIVTVIAMIVMIGYFRSTGKDEILTRCGLVLMISGTIGNFIDRMLFQHVRDFLDFIIFGYDFPVFNIADICLCVGVALVICAIAIEQIWGLKK